MRHKSIAHPLPSFLHFVLLLSLDVGQLDRGLDVILPKQIEAGPLTHTHECAGGLRTQAAAYMRKDESAFAERALNIDRSS